jgi:hypothetical protein
VIPRGRCSNLHYLANSLWGDIQARDIIPFKSAAGTTTKPKYAANSDEFRKLAEEAFTILLNQWLYIQCSVVNMGTKLKLFPPKRFPPQTDIEQLVQLGDKLPAAICMDKYGNYFSSDAAVWQFLQDSAPVGAS